MKLFITLLITAMLAHPGMKYRSGLHEDVQAAFYEKAERAYQSILDYDANARVTKEEILRLFRRRAAYAPFRRAIAGFAETIDKYKRRTPKSYAEQCIYEGRILENAPDGVVFVCAYLYPFSPDQAERYDDIQKNGDYRALDALFSPLEEKVHACMGAYTVENGFLPYFAMQDDSAVIPCAEGVLYLTEEAVFRALSLSEEAPFAPPVRDARGVIVFEYVTGSGRPSEAFFQGS